MRSRRAPWRRSCGCPARKPTFGIAADPSTADTSSERRTRSATADRRARSSHARNHPATGPAIAGSRDVFVNRLPAIRVSDPGIHASCCGQNTWNAKTGSRSVLINGRSAHRLGDLVKHCGGIGQTIEGSPNVIVGDNSYAYGQDSAIASKRNHKLTAQIVFEDDVPLSREPYEIVADGVVVRRGQLDKDGWLRENQIPQGNYEIRLANGWIISGRRP